MTELLREDTSINPVIKDRIEKIQQGIVPEGYRKSDVGIIPKEWNVFKLVDVSKDGGKYGINARAVTFNKSLPKYLRITDISDDGKYISENKKSVDNKNSKNYLLQKNDIVFARTGNTTGKTYLYQEKDKDLIYAGFLIKYSIDDQIANPKLIFYHTQTNRYWNWVKIMSARSGQPGINSKEYNNLQFSLGSLKEQQKIADILSTWDRAIELKESLIKEKEEQKKGLVQKVFLDATIRWKNTRLKKLVYEPDKNRVEKPWNIELLTVRLHNKGVIKSGKYPNKTKSGRPYFKRYTGELLIGRQNLHNGGIGFVSNEHNGLICSNAITSLLPKRGINMVYIYYYLSNPDYYKRIENLIGGTGQKEISKNELMNLKIKIPSEADQNIIAHSFITVDKQISLLKQEVELLKEQKKGLMQLLLTGIVRVGEVEKLE